MFMFLLRRADGSLYENVAYIATIGEEQPADDARDLKGVRRGLGIAYPEAEILLVGKVDQ